MTIKKTFTLLCFFIFAFAHSQLPPMVPTFGEPLPEEFLMDSYAPDPEAPAVVLYERANNFLDVYDGKIMIAKEVHVKMKVFDAKRFENAMIEIPYIEQ